MTKDNEIIYIDQDTFSTISGKKSKKSYLTFLKDNPRFVDFKDYQIEDSNKNLFEETKTKEEIENSLEHNLEKTEDYRYVLSLIWLEMYLPKYETKYGKFNYSSKSLTNQEKCNELLDYYANVCGIGDIKYIPLNAKSIKGKLH